MTRFGSTNWRTIFLGAVIGALGFGAADAASQTQRQPTAASTQVNPALIEAVVNPLKSEVQTLRTELNRQSRPSLPARSQGSGQQEAHDEA